MTDKTRESVIRILSALYWFSLGALALSLLQCFTDLFKHNYQFLLLYPPMILVSLKEYLSTSNEIREKQKAKERARYDAVVKKYGQAKVNRLYQMGLAAILAIIVGTPIAASYFSTLQVSIWSIALLLSALAFITYCKKPS